MISFSTIKSGADAASYYADQERRAAEYYADQGRVPSRWLGAGAAIQGLRGEVGQQALTAQLAGQVQDANGSARSLGIQRAGQFQHLSGWDLTVSAPKSVSLESLVHGRDDVTEAHRRAVEAAAHYLEKHAAMARINGAEIITGNMTVAAYDHVSSRAGDPQLHTHLIIANVTHDADGRARSINNRILLDHRRAADAVYHATLSRELQHLGYQVRHDRNGHVEIAGYSPEQLRDFSTRSREIEQTLAARGQTRETASAEARQVAALATRADKNLPETRAAHAARWQGQAEALGIAPAERGTPHRGPGDWDQAQIASQAVAEAAAHLTEREAVMRIQDLHREAARMSEGRCAWEHIEAALADAIDRGELVREADGPRLTTRDLLHVERETDARLEAGRGAHRAVMSDRQLTAALAKFETARGFALTDEQRNAARMILTGADRYQGVQGLAGTGKTTLLSFVREAAEAQGWRVVGHSSGAEQAATMQRESGIDSSTTAAWLLDAQDAKASALDQRVLVIMDEASQSGARQYLAALDATERLGARAVMLGDRYQHQSVEAGRAFARSQSHMPVAILGAQSIRRQRTTEAREAVGRVLSGDHAAAVKGLRTVEVCQAQSMLAETAPRDDRRAAARADNNTVIRRLASDYAALPAKQRVETLIVTSTNVDRQAINIAIREQLRLRGELGESIAIATLRKADLTAAEAKRAASYTVGQVVEVRSDYRREQLARGSQWTVLGSDGPALRVRDAAGRERVIDPARIQIQAYDRGVRELAVGERIRWTENHRADRADQPAVPGLRVRNGSTATVERIAEDGRTITLRTASGERIALDTQAGQKLDHAYAATSYAAQGLTVDRVLLHHNVEAGAHGDREAYVSITRARDSVVLYTQDAQRAAAQSGLTLDKSAAHDVEHAPVEPTREHHHEPVREHHHEPTRDHGPHYG